MPEVICPFVLCRHNNKHTSVVGYCTSQNVAFKSVDTGEEELLDCLCFEYEKKKTGEGKKECVVSE